LRTQVRHGEIADDLAEATFVELVLATDVEFADGVAVRGWLFRAARNNLIDWRRRAERRADHELPRRLAETHVDPDAGPEDAVLEHDAVAEVLDAMLELSDDQQEVLRLRLLGQLSAQEVGELTGRTEGAVRALQHRGLRSLARVLEQRRVTEP
jgi:RNA polymerase sigma-70 factor (ECF subfamily)